MNYISPKFLAPQQANAAGQVPSGATHGPGSEALVKNAKFAATFREVTDENTGEIQRFRYDNKRSEFVLDLGPDVARSNRFSLQGASRRLLPELRVAGCMRKLAGGSFVTILKHAKTERCHFGGLQTCGSPWTCPVCSAKISERRKLEIREAVDTHIEAGGGVEMLTLTMRHGRMDVLSDMMGKLREALRTTRMHRAYKNLRRDFGVLGSIRALEVTHGQANGWHPHFHELWLFAKPLTVRQRISLRRLLFGVWCNASVSAGLPAPSAARGVHIQPATSAAEYMAKWGCDPRWEAGSELAKSNSKRSKNAKGRTPFDLLRSYSEQDDKQAGALFIEFAKAFRGYNQVRWSKGLKAAFGIAEKTAEEIAAEQVEPAVKLGLVRRRQWRLVLGQRYEGRANLLQVAESGGFAAVRILLRSLLVLHLRGLSGGFRPLNADIPFSRNLFALRRLRRATSRLQRQALQRPQVFVPPVLLVSGQIALRLC